LDKVLGSATNLTSAIDAVIRPQIPKTFYFSEYAQLDGRYKLDDVIAELGKESDDESSLRSAADFLTLAKVDPANAESWEFEQLNAELEAVSSLLTRKVKENWKQNQHLKLRVRVESEKQPNNVLVRYLQFRVEDTRHDFSNRLDRRSTGFRWFVSFIASFFEFQKDKNIILLLDEPGLSLHARAQMDLLDAIDSNLTDGRQVLYTTHSPFMVRTEALERVRIVEDKGPEVGATVTNEAGIVSDPDTLFPLQAALGYDVAQNLFIGRRNVLIEGTSDFIYLTTLSSHLGSLKRAQLPASCRLLPAGGATNIPTFIALLGNKIEVVVLLDGDAQRQRIDSAIAQGRLNAANVLSLDKFSLVKGADIEDLFEPEEYVEMYNEAFGAKLKIAGLKGQDRIVKRIERAAGEFDHGRVAGQFLLKQNDYLKKLSPETLQRFEALIAAIVKALPDNP
jgi:predicted ATP-dependent endonuclease of OLD family